MNLYSRTDQHTLERLRGAVDRLVAPRPRLTVTAMAAEAGLSRATANRYPEAIEYLKQRQDDTPEARIAQLEERIAQLRAEHRNEVAELTEALEILVQRIQLLTVALEQRPRADRTVTDLASWRRPGPGTRPEGV